MTAITVSFSDDPEPVKPAGPLPTAATLLRELKGVVESGDLSAGTRVRIRLATQDSTVVFDGEWSETGVIFGQEPEIMLCHNLDEREEEELLRSLQNKKAIRANTGPPGRNRGAALPDTERPQHDSGNEPLLTDRQREWLFGTTAGRVLLVVLVLLLVALLLWVVLHPGSGSPVPLRWI